MALGISGCTNPTATNYNPLATIDDGSCIGGLTPGCCDPTATNFDPLATCDDGSCLYTGGSTCLTCGTGGDDSVPGCCDLSANNYNPLATCNDGSCQYTFDSWNCNECAVLVNCDGWNGISGHLPLMGGSSATVPRTDTGQTFTTYEEVRAWYFDNPTISCDLTYFTIVSPVLGNLNTTYFINGIDWGSGTKGVLQFYSYNLFSLSSGQYGISPSAGPQTPIFGGNSARAENVINWYMNEGLPVYQGMTWQQFKTVVPWAEAYLVGSIVDKASCCAQGTGFTCEQAVGGSFTTEQLCIDAGCGTV